MALHQRSMLVHSVVQPEKHNSPRWRSGYYSVRSDQPWWNRSVSSSGGALEAGTAGLNVPPQGLSLIHI